MVSISTSGYVKIPHLRDGAAQNWIISLHYQSIGEIILIAD